MAKRTKMDTAVLERLAGNFIGTLKPRQLEHLQVLVIEAMNPGMYRAALERDAAEKS